MEGRLFLAPLYWSVIIKMTFYPTSLYVPHV